ncbi:FAD:protein FMN transferase [Iamia sp. SCSIO 61187]|uniref:FAD:protein FMN transferase n=1 Tax=Iamia sp. SCSIO 61187 TaxID=2722752 RepID=UPI001C625775|nr:FAD:protein FMN transferase [Iamia sp. SCSIO 61187]QYG93510.1 FAD:protein FMN transferase [Iamia sp. SCSIO 61187]
MASEVRIVAVDAPSGSTTRAMARIDELERRWSRFRPTSDISRINRAAGAEVPVSSDTIVLVAAMVEGWRSSAGRFDPTTLPDLVGAGYGRSVVDGCPAVPLPAAARRGADLREIVLDPLASTVRVPAGTVLDPGGIGKGLAADLVATDLVDAGAGGVLVSIGGDLVVAGTPPRRDRWAIDVEDPLAPATAIVTLHVDRGGIATSSTESRRWRVHGAPRHHLIDPTTGHPARTDLASATVVAETAWQAEVAATAALLLGRGDGLAHLAGEGLAGVLVGRDGTALTSPATPSWAPGAVP